MAKKENEVNLSEIDPTFVISQFKNKERRNNPSSTPRALIPDYEIEKEQEAEQPEEKETLATVPPETPREETKRKRSKSPDYESLFLTDAGIPTRSGKLVSIREKYHKRIAKIVQALDRKNVSIFSYIDNVLSHHFDTYQDEINEIYNRENDDDYIIPKN